MRLGFYANYTPNIAEFAHNTGFKSMQLSAWPGSALDANEVTPGAVAALQEDLDSKDIEISALGYYPNYLTPDEVEREAAQEYFPKVLALASRMGVSVVSTFAGRNPELTIEENMPAFTELFSRFCEDAEKLGVKIALENCPMISAKTHKSQNIAFSPEIWEAIFDAVSSDYLGLEFDPSHLVWLGIDHIEAIRDFSHKIFHVHAKDMEIDRSILQRSGILGRSFGPKIGPDRRWWRARVPGWGQIDWPKFISAVIRSGYQGNIDIENEDDVFANMSSIKHIQSEADVVARYSQEKAGLQLGYNTLAPLISPLK